MMVFFPFKQAASFLFRKFSRDFFEIFGAMLYLLFVLLFN